MNTALLFELTHGWRGLALAYGGVQGPMWAAMARGRAALERWSVSPVLAAPLVLATGAVMAWAAPAIRAAGLGAGVADSVGLGLGALLGYAGGHVLSAAPRECRERPVRGAVVRNADEPLPQQRGGGKTRGREHGPAEERATGVTLAGIAVPERDESKHFKLIGATGTGKSTAIRELLEGALERGDRAVIADPDGVYLKQFYDARRGDVILSPFEAAGRRWDLFGEITDAYDIDQLALSLIPDQGGSDRSWRAYARTLFSAVTAQAREAGVSDVAQLYDLLVTGERDELKMLAGGTPAQPFFEEHNDRMLDSIRSVLSSAVGALRYVADQDAEPLSVRRWVQSGRSVLFVPYRAAQIAALRSSISAWMRLAIFETLNGAQDARPLWFVADELDALGPIDGLKDALARLRKFGGRCVLGFQSIAQVSATYGAGDAQTIVENCGNTLILRCSAGEHGGTSRFASQLIGEREVVRLARSTSRHPGSAEPSVTDAEHRQVEPAVMASQIERLADLAGYLKLASSPDWLRVALRPPVREFGRAAQPAPMRQAPAAGVQRVAGIVHREATRGMYDIDDGFEHV